MTDAKVLSVAKSQIGTKEAPKDSNNVKYNTWYYGREVSGSQYPWCCVFVAWVFREAGASDLFFDGQKTAYCPTLLNYYKKKKQIVTDYKPGDIVFFNFSGGSTAQHVGICTAWDGTSITTIDGNTGTENEANGGAVMLRKRNKKYIVAVARPDYTEGGSTVNVTLNVLRNGSKGDSVRALQVLLNGFGYSCGSADGVFGKNTETAVKKFQTKNKLSADGVVGAQTWAALLS